MWVCFTMLKCESYVLYSVAVNFGVNLFFLFIYSFLHTFFLSFLLSFDLFQLLLVLELIYSFFSFILSFCLFYCLLICFSHMTVTTRHRSVAVGTKLEYDGNGHIVSKTPTPRQVCGWNIFFLFWHFLTRLCYKHTYMGHWRTCGIGTVNIS